jgi:hypothetical protein
MSNIPNKCPSCGANMVIVKLQCPECNTEVTGEFKLCPVCRLDEEFRKLFDLFLKSRGNLKDVQRELKVSYPTARAKIEKMFNKMDGKNTPISAAEILSDLRNGKITVDEAEKILRL